MVRWLPRRDRQAVFDAAREALDGGRLEEAADGFRRAIELGEDSWAVWFNLGVAEKLQHNWAASADANRRSIDRDREPVEARWNLGVVATALRDWETARWAWQSLGFDVGPDTPPVADFGTAPVRLSVGPDGGGEVVWGRRVDPCRLRVESVPMPESGHRFGDIVLHDVVPHGERRANGNVYSVFDELERMDPSDLPTHDVTVTAAGQEDVQALAVSFLDAGLGAEDWTTVQFICAQCSVSDAHHHDGEETVPPWHPERRMGLAAPGDDADRLLAAWAGGATGREVGERRQVG